MKTRLTISLTLLLIGLVGTSVIMAAQGPPTPLGIVPTPISRPLTVNLWTDKSTYAVGETMRVYVNVNQPAYIYLYDIQPDGVVRRVFPNIYSQSNFVSGGTHVLPNRPSYHHRVTHPTGVEKLQILASLRPLTVTPSTYSEPFPMTTPREIQRYTMGIAAKPARTTAWTSFTIIAPTYSYTPLPRYKPPTPSYTPLPRYKPPTPSYTPLPRYKPAPPGPPSSPFFEGCFPGWSWWSFSRGQCGFSIRIRIGCGP